MSEVGTDTDTRCLPCQDGEHGNCVLHNPNFADEANGYDCYCGCIESFDDEDVYSVNGE